MFNSWGKIVLSTFEICYKPENETEQQMKIAMEKVQAFFQEMIFKIDGRVINDCLGA